MQDYHRNPDGSFEPRDREYDDFQPLTVLTMIIVSLIVTFAIIVLSFMVGRSSVTQNCAIDEKATVPTMITGNY
jgi:hypothetical protein